MPRSNTILQSQHPYHVTARCINREWFQLPIKEVWDIFSRQLTFVSWLFGAEIHSFVLLSNHFHLLVSTPKANLDKIMANLMRETSRYLNESSGRINQTYGRRYFKSVISSYHYYLHAYKYIYLNPVQAGIVSRCEEYPFSSLRFKIGLEQATFPVTYDGVLFEDFHGTLKWINRRPTKENWDAIHEAMRKSQFKIRKDSSYKKPHSLENDML